MDGRRLVAFWPPALIIGVWQIAVSLGWLNALFFPSPAHLLVTAWELVRSGEIERHLAVTVARLVMAFLLGSGTGIPVGVMLGSSVFWRRSLQSLFGGLNATPKLVLLPAFLVLFGLNEGSRILPAALGCFALTTLHSMDAARGVSQGYLDLARSYGAGRRALFFRVYIPACLPGLFTGMRLGMANALVMVVAMELLSSASGIGSFIWLTSQTLALDRMYVGIALCTLMGIAKNYTFNRIERRITPWAFKDGG
jgi:ABC-type nitrate/sulfonate/bicarbonate transport system permease component